MAGGFRPIQDISGGSYTGKVQTFAVDSGHATLLAVGDLVRITGTARASDGMAEVDAAAATQTITGPIVAIDFNVSNMQSQGLAASTAGTVKVATDRNILMEAGGNATVALTDVGVNCDIVATAATASGGLVNSNMVIGISTASAASGQIRIEGLKDGNITAASVIYCRVNESTADTAGV